VQPAGRFSSNQPEITLGLPGRDQKIQDLCDFITDLGKAGIHYHTYAHMATGIWSSGSTEGRGGLGALLRQFRPQLLLIYVAFRRFWG